MKIEIDEEVFEEALNLIRIKAWNNNYRMNAFKDKEISCYFEGQYHAYDIMYSLLYGLKFNQIHPIFKEDKIDSEKMAEQKQKLMEQLKKYDES
jgi:hypothetical protein